MSSKPSGVLEAIGGTPLVRLGASVPDGAAEVWVKVEGANPTGSYKDRMAVSVVIGALERGDVAPGDTIVEYTGGSTGTSLAFVCAVQGLEFTAVFSDAFSNSKKQAMEAFGATVLTEPSHGAGITPELAGRMRARAYALAEEPGHYYADQFGSPDVRRGYTTLGTEIAVGLDRDVDVLCVAPSARAAHSWARWMGCDPPVSPRGSWPLSRRSRSCSPREPRVPTAWRVLRCSRTRRFSTARCWRRFESSSRNAPLRCVASLLAWRGSSPADRPD